MSVPTESLWPITHPFKLFPIKQCELDTHKTGYKASIHSPGYLSRQVKKPFSSRLNSLPISLIPECSIRRFDCADNFYIHVFGYFLVLQVHSLAHLQLTQYPVIFPSNTNGFLLPFLALCVTTSGNNYRIT